MNTQHLMSLPADAPDWVWTQACDILDQARGTELNRTPTKKRPAAIVARVGAESWIAATFDVEGNGEVLGFTALQDGVTPDLPMIISALDNLGLLR